MIRDNTPFELRDLKINGDDIIKKYPKINLENMDILLDNLLQETVISPKKNNKKELLLIAGKLINSKRNLYLDE